MNLFGKSNIFKYVSMCQTLSYDFRIMNAMCTFVYLFVVYFSFAPVISASVHRYVNYSDVQVLMRVTETETLASTLHHNKFTHLDYVFLLPSYSRILIHIYFHIGISNIFTLPNFVELLRFALRIPTWRYNCLEGLAFGFLKSVNNAIYLSIYLSIYLFIYLSIYHHRVTGVNRIYKLHFW